MFEKKDDFTPTMDGQNIETIVGSSVKLKGNLKSDGDININGHVSGDIRTKASVQIGGSANVIASIKAKNVYVSGMVQGNVETTDTLQISETGRIYGDIQAGILVVSPGAVFSGKCTMSETKKEVELEPILEVEDTQEKEKSNKK